ASAARQVFVCRNRAENARRDGYCEPLKCRVMRFVASKCVFGRKWLWIAAFALAGMTVKGAEPLRQHPDDIVGTMSCTAVSCHGGGGAGYWSGSTKGAEYVHWLGH